MQNWTEILEAWRALPARRIKRSTIKLHPALQPRNPYAVGFKNRHKVIQESDEHCRLLTDRLAICPDLDPILVAEIEGELFVVDGHHRLKAYKLNGRNDIPAKVFETNWDTAVMVSKLVNLDHRALRMHKEQAREACWQYLAKVTLRGQKSHTEATSYRKVAALFGVSPDTAQRMVKTLPLIKLRDFTKNALDPGTGWPFWKECKGNGNPFELAPDYKLAERQAEKIAIQLGKQEADINTMALLLLFKECLTDIHELPQPLTEVIEHYSRMTVRN